jgi:hypothetical protein
MNNLFTKWHGVSLPECCSSCLVNFSIGKDWELDTCILSVLYINTYLKERKVVATCKNVVPI